MNNNIKLLFITNPAANKDYDLDKTIDNLGLHKVIRVEGSKAAIKEFVDASKSQPFSATLICELPQKEELELLKALIEIDPDQYIFLLYQDVTAEKVLSAIKHGASGVLNAPFTPEKIRLELEKYSLLREERRVV
jgi:DNA-binding NarL/FixJ family response regulator